MRGSICKKLILIAAVLAALCLLLVGCGETSETVMQSGDNTQTADNTEPGDNAQNANTCTVTFDTQGGSEVAVQQVEKGDKAQKPQDPERAGYTFLGWTYQGEAWSFVGYVVTDNMTLTAEWQINTYFVTYALNGGSYVPNNPMVFTVESDAFVLTAPTKTGYTFTGWTWEEQTEPQLAVTVPAGTHEDKAFTANWQVNTYTVTFDGNGGTVPLASKQVIFDAAYTLPTPTDAPVGYAFAGWYDGTTRVMDGIWRTTSDKTLTAHWTAKNDIAYTVNHYQQNIENDEYTLFETQNLIGTADSAVTPATRTYTGFTAPAAQIITINPDGSRVVNYYYMRNTYTVTFVTNGGEAIAPITQKYQPALSLPTSTRAGFTFGGWFTDVGLTTAITAVPAEDITVYAGWMEENKPGDFTYSGTDAISITGYYGSATFVVIPAYIGGVPVTNIGNSAFSDCTSLASIIIPNSVTSIGERAFYECTDLTNVTIPDSVTNIGEYAFCKCERLTSVTIPDGVTSINDYAFYKCAGLTSIIIPNGVIDVGERAFFGCRSLTSIIIPGGVMSIGERAFRSCTGLTTITIPDSVTNIGDEAFYNCDSLTYNTHDNAKYLGNATNPYVVLVKAISTDITSCTIHTDAKFIHSSAFYGCSSLTSITIPNGVTRIGSGAFQSTGLTSVTIGNNVTSIGDSAFYGCRGLTSVTIPDSVTSIGYAAFYGCTDLISITYQGTKVQWNDINKVSSWNNNTGHYTIYCTDGNIIK